MSSFSFSWRPVSALLVMSVASLSVSSAALASDWALRGSIYHDRAATDSDDGAGNALQLEPRIGGALEVTRSFDLGNQQKLDLYGRARVENYPDHRDSNRYFADLGGDYIINYRQSALQQLRLFWEYTHARDDHATVFDRIRAGASARYGIAERSSLRFHGRLGYREQDDGNTFVGYDQMEYLVDVMHLWRSEDSKWRSGTTAYYEARRADRDIYSYDEFGLRLVGRRQIVDGVMAVGRLSGFTRDYDAGGREDNRIRATLGAEWALSEKDLVEAYVGYTSNNSNVVLKDYSGGIFGVQLSHDF